MASFDEVVNKIIDLPGSEKWKNGYEAGKLLEEKFPGEEGSDFAYCIYYNDIGPLTEHNIVRLACPQVGERDSDSWIWVVELDDGSVWKMEGWCDYTGWDCQSGNEWTLQ